MRRIVGSFYGTERQNSVQVTDSTQAQIPCFLPLYRTKSGHNFKRMKSVGGAGRPVHAPTEQPTSLFAAGFDAIF
jgi:hypothetical protein